MSHGLGRRHSPDPRDAAYPLRAVIPAEPPPPFRYWWTGGAWLDQGNSGTCVGHAWAHYIEDGPTTHPGSIDPFGIYADCTQVDEWAENDNGDPNFGTSVRAGAKVLQARGLISEYRWAWSADEAVNAVLTVGPVVLGTIWTSGMFYPDAEGIVRYEGSIAGGHAYLMNGVNQKRGLARCKNSWGRHWSKGGAFWLPLEDLDRLIRDDGEAALALEVKT